MRSFSEFNRQAIATELNEITLWWQTHSIDTHNGGFVGEVSFDGEPQEQANKGIILNSRILWFFSELAVFHGVTTEQGKHALNTAQRAYEYIIQYFDDEQYGGAIWEVTYQGEKLDCKKQTYAQCFCIYAFSAFYKATKNVNVLNKAMEYFALVENHARDPKLGGYIEAYQQDWQSIDDFRLSDKDMNTPKSMNTHLHVLEAYAALYHVNPAADVEKALRHVLDVFEQHVLDGKSGHLKLFFTLEWQDQSTSYSYGHDIEASWLIWEAVEYLADPSLVEKWRSLIVHMANVCTQESIGRYGQVCEDFDKLTQDTAQEAYWWVQAEALVGFLNAYYLTGDKHLLSLCEDIWFFIQEFHKDPKAGEWHWLADTEGLDNAKSYKAGFWKGPYHNGRAMMEVMQLFDKLQAS